MQVMIFELMRNPLVIPLMARKLDLSQIRIFKETICSSLYENPLSDEAFEPNLLRVLGEVLKVHKLSWERFVDFL